MLALWCAFQILMPLRTHLYGGEVTWHEQGMRFSWRVMLREKSGDITFRVRAAEWDGEKQISPDRYLTAYQERVMAGQPDMIVQLARHIREDLETNRGLHDVQVRTSAWVSLNGRKPQLMLDPKVDISRIKIGLAPAAWITAAPDERPPSLRRRKIAER